MAILIALALAVFSGAPAGLKARPTAQAQERPVVPKDSMALVVTGCLKGRALAASEARQVDVQIGPDVRGRSFRLAAKKDVMKEIKAHDGQMVEATGLIKRSALAEPGFKVGRTRIVIGAPPMGRDPTRNVARDPIASVIVMDVTAVEALGAACGG